MRESLPDRPRAHLGQLGVSEHKGPCNRPEIHGPKLRLSVKASQILLTCTDVSGLGEISVVRQLV